MSFAGTRKHLNLLVQDYGVSTKRSSIESTTDKAEQMAQIIEEEKAKKSFEPPYIVGGTHARDIARMVNARRTPSGNFFQVTNPSLAPTVMECRNQRHKSFADMTKKSSKSLADESGFGDTQVMSMGETTMDLSVGGDDDDLENDEAAATATNTKVQIDETANTVNEFSASATRSWTMPSLINDRSNGARVAKLVASKRTPTGGYASWRCIPSTERVCATTTTQSRQSDVV